jgi:hypothetical protein
MRRRVWKGIFPNPAPEYEKSFMNNPDAETDRPAAVLE